MMVFKHWQVLQ